MVSSSSSNVFLWSIIVLQWGLVTVLLVLKPNATTNQPPPPLHHDYFSTPPATSLRLSSQNSNSSSLDGVAVTLIFRAPQWFHLRYKVMIDNAKANLPQQKNWKLQVFLHPEFYNQTLTPWHPGIVQMVSSSSSHSQIITTMLPSQFTTTTKKQQHIKPKHILSSKWFWEHVQAEKVILFSGNGAFCGNRRIANDDNDFIEEEELLSLDYCGVPWKSHRGRFGDASSHSIRSRSAMLRVIEYYHQQKKQQQQQPNHPNDDHDIIDFVSVMEEMEQRQQQLPNNNHRYTFRIATPEQTYRFGGVHDLVHTKNHTTTGTAESVLHHLPMVVAGTQAQLTYAERDTLLKHCPELKIIFPSIHEPSCFGARNALDPEKCKATICALADEIPSHGC
jgi:hypothetical protein